MIAQDEIRWIEAERNYVRLHTERGAYLLRTTLDRIEGDLVPGSFVRVHRSAIVRVDAVREVIPIGQGEQVLVLDDGTRVKIARARRELFRDAVAGGREASSHPTKSPPTE